MKKKNELGFQELENTKEYMETHYFDNPSAGPFPNRFEVNKFYLDYLKYLLYNTSLEGKLSDKGFLTS